MALTPEARFRAVADYAADVGYAAAFPNFHEANYGRGSVGGVHLLQFGAVDWRDVPASELGSPPLWDVPRLFRAANDYAVRNGYLAGFPNCHQTDYGAGQVFGVHLIKHGAGEWRDVPRSQLGNPTLTNVADMMRAAASYASSTGFAAGFPTFHESGGASGVYGVVLLPATSADWRDVALLDLEPVSKKTCVLLMQLRNDDGSPYPPLQDKVFYRNYFFARHGDSVAHYFRVLSNYRVNVVGDVFGWLDAGHSLTELNNSSNQRQRITAYDWAVAAAQAAGIRVGDYDHTVVLVNRHCDFGGWGPLAITIPAFGAPDSDPNFTNHYHSFLQHEFGHAIGLNHTLGPAGQYDDPFCIMSYQVHDTSHRRTICGITANGGGGLNAFTAAQLGAFPDHRRIDILPERTTETHNIVAQGFPDINLSQAIRILPSSDRTSTYWIAFRAPERWDIGYGRRWLTIHEHRQGENQGRVVGSSAGWGLINAGDTRMIDSGKIKIRLNGFDSTGRIANVSVLSVRTRSNKTLRPGRPMTQPLP